MPKFYIPLTIIVEAEDAAAAYASVWDRLESDHYHDDDGEVVEMKGCIVLHEEDVNAVPSTG